MCFFIGFLFVYCFLFFIFIFTFFFSVNIICCFFYFLYYLFIYLLLFFLCLLFCDKLIYFYSMTFCSSTLLSVFAQLLQASPGIQQQILQNKAFLVIGNMLLKVMFFVGGPFQNCYKEIFLGFKGTH